MGLDGRFAAGCCLGARLMRRTPVITLAVVLSLALGIGANTAIIPLMDVVLWRDLPVPNPRQLDLVQWQGMDFHESWRTAHRAAFGIVAAISFPIRVFGHSATVFQGGLRWLLFPTQVRSASVSPGAHGWGRNVP